MSPASYVVDFNATDQAHPQNRSTGRKLTIALILSYVTFVSAFASAIFSTILEALEDEFHISEEGITFYVLGFATGPILWAPASELYGRRWLILTGMFGHSVFTIATATAKFVQTYLVTRLFAGLFSARPVATVPACLADLYDT
ncbi:MFS general substrate transporter [Penicillium argentinense]|uniref:MFS general substrate transporter n=1 Tax=Penicillium argentinense TaxID=1131581 RepID=A0A9W9JXA7_9EURO|nr:MFS general substrate transporter [Penicillium argentinense]KAJ5085304.1 MFS general substrate transporter [Penicillium argentinense]